MYDMFVRLNLADDIQQCAWNEYCKAVIAMYRYVVHKRLEIEWSELDKEYRNVLFDYLYSSNIGIYKKIEYWSFLFSYNLACVFHKSS